MKPFRKHKAVVAHLDRENVDTDQIIPKQFLKRIERTGYGPFLFYDWRRIQEGPNAGEPHPDFILNQPAYQDAEILIAGKNFGCGSSREHAAWALNDYGFRCVIALMARAASIPRYQLTVSLEDEMLHDDHGLSIPFSIDPFRRECLLLGLDDIGLSLKHGGALEKFEQHHDKEFWLAPRPADTKTYLGAL
jgi:3-isopropylmalate/(R)-2-methylmalate dehydratase small subunit